MTAAGPRTALAVVAAALAAQIEPAQPLAPSLWAIENLVVPDGPKAGEPWSLALTPYIAEPLDNFGPDAAPNEQAVRKSAQTGFTTLLIAAIGHSIDRDPCRMMLIQPTDAALSDFNRDKLQPAIDASAILKRKVEPQSSRSGVGSTTYSKRYPKGSLTLAIASSGADLRSKTVKKLLRDEIDEYPDDLDGQGDPLDISDGRLLSFLESGDWKKIDISTPTIKGASKIERRFDAGDKRFWHVRCPGCEAEFYFKPGANFKHEPVPPFDAHYIAPCCGRRIEGHEKNALVRGGRWIATEPRPGAFPSYHCDVFISPFVPFDAVAKAITAAGDNPLKLKTLYNLWYGLPFEVKGDAPDHVRLMERRIPLKRGHVPAGGLILVASADVQMRGIWLEVKAFGRDRQSWVVDALYIDGETSSPTDGAFAKLAQLTLDREFPDAFGGTRKLDALGVDSGYRSHVVYAWVRRNQRVHEMTGRDIVHAIDGRSGWGKPPMGTPSLVDIDLAGVKLKKGCQLWPVGTWPIKGAFYADLRKEGLQAGADRDPEGYCHFGTWLDETYFKQITSEYLTDEVKNGKTSRVWKLKASESDNHLLDCAVYNIALAEHLGLSNLTDDDWDALTELRGGSADELVDTPEEVVQPIGLSPPPSIEPPVAQPRPPAPTADDYYARLAALNSDN